jgi:two-component system, OmpR family, response regulator PrrA
MGAMSAAIACSDPRGVVAVVDDDPEIRRALGDWLALAGFAGCGHASAESLLAELDADGGGLRLGGDARDARDADPGLLLGAVLDVSLPGVSGVDLARTLRGRAPELPLALITALSAEELRRFGQAPAGVACLRKPFELEALEAALGARLFPAADGPAA